ncbi:hypothetical protein RvY_07935 [Ramazzottius varieornatus]|uniref:Mitochondrial assembly of ribosomal large subunit protein 1 n=1 Tax=Ramazzottius varieornatus TaxID=947166 RepID=A0A1D1V6I4_RAMVA|nr:hypothetical protein RvY_07935 [Ramazzottius varieornatus]
MLTCLLLASRICVLTRAYILTWGSSLRIDCRVTQPHRKTLLGARMNVLQSSFCRLCGYGARQLTTTSVWARSTGIIKGRPNRSPNSREDEDGDQQQTPPFKPIGRKKGGEEPAASLEPQQNIRNIPPSLRNRYRLFEDEAEEVRDSNQAQWIEIEAPEEEDTTNEFEGLSLTRGKTGVIDIHELVDVLQQENAVDLCVVSIPPEVKFADYMVVVCGKSSRQLMGMAKFVSRYYKAKKNVKDPFLNSSIANWKTNWIVLDLGNIIVHFMDAHVRKAYDIEALWALGSENDPQSQQYLNPDIALMEKHSRVFVETPNADTAGARQTKSS